MSSNAHSGATANADTPVASRTRRQARERSLDDDENDDQKQPAQSSTHISPAMRLYRHALESIFAMLGLRDLSRALAVSRSWSAAVRNMQPIGATIDRRFLASKDRRPRPPIERLISSPLMRHIATLEASDSSIVPFRPPLTREALALLVQHAPNLTSLDCNISPAPPAPWILPAKLTSLKLYVEDSFPAADANALFCCLSALPALGRLHLKPPHDYSVAGVDFSLLAASPSLTDVIFRYQIDEPPLSNKQVNQICASLGHLHRFSLEGMGSDTLARLLRPPVTARWQDIGTVRLDAAAELMLVTLPSLTRLHVHFEDDRLHLDFLSQLPLLTGLKLWNKKLGGFYVPPVAMLNSLLACTGLTELDLRAGFNSAQWTVLFAKLTSLTKLTIDGDLESLECLASGPIEQTLKDLELRGLYLPPSELVHLHALRDLRALHFDHCFDPPLDAATRDSLFPPNQILPMLTQFNCAWRFDGHKPDRVERVGPSFEQMQQRSTQ